MNIRISGNFKGPTVIFLAGWPDTCDVFEGNLMAALRPTCRVVGLSLPGFDDELTFFRQFRRSQQRATASYGMNDMGAESDSSSARSRSSSSTRGFMSRASLSRLPAKAPWVGHSFADLVTLLEIAVDTAMETHNYYMTQSSSPGTATSKHSSRSAAAGGIVVGSQPSPDSTFLSQPVLITHGWGCLLAYELLLSRPNLFSKLVALDVGAAIFDHNEVRRALCHHCQTAPCGTPSPRSFPFSAPQQKLKPLEDQRCHQTAQGVDHVEEVRLKGRAAHGDSHLLHTAGALTRIALWCWHVWVLFLFLCVPKPLANLLLECTMWCVGRPTYREAAGFHMTPESELFNQRLEQHWLNSTKAGDTPAVHTRAPGVDGRSGELFDLPLRNHSPPSPGWQIVLMPFIGVAEKAPPVPHSSVAAPRVALVVRGYAKAVQTTGSSVGYTASTGSLPHGYRSSVEPDPYYAAYEPTGANRVFQESTTTQGTAGGKPHSSSSRSTSTDITRTLYRKREVVYVPYYIPPHAISPVDSQSLSPLIVEGRRWFSYAWWKSAVSLRWNTRSEMDDEDKDHHREPRTHGCPSIRVRGVDRMGWIFLRFAFGSFLSRLFSPSQNWATSFKSPKRQRRPLPKKELLSCDGSPSCPSGRLLVTGEHHSNDTPDATTSTCRCERLGVGKGENPSFTLTGADASFYGDPKACKDTDETSSCVPRPFVPRQVMHSPLTTQRFFLPVHVPLLFLYGTGKRCLLHSSQWSQYVQWKGQLDGGVSRVVPVDGGGHWFFAEETHREQVAREVERFLFSSTA